MFKIATSVVMLLSLTLTVWSQGKDNNWLTGTWQGRGYQTDSSSTWSMWFKASGDGYSIEYPSLECGGEWRLISIDSSKAKFKEKITYGKSRCLDNGLVIIERLNGRQAVFLYYPEDSDEANASAILRKRP
ncbi:MAG TPA: hypothetical protein VF297_17595 [Pyrinomonadaceae bacterium]